MLTSRQKAELAARRVAALQYRDCSAWSVTIRKTYGVRSLFRDLKSDLAQAIVVEKTDEQIRESIHVTPEGGMTQFTAEESYLIAQSLQSDVQPSKYYQEPAMPLFLITSLYDEGISPNVFRLVEAESKRVIAQHMLEHPDQWDYFLYRSFHEERLEPTLTAEQLLERMEQTHVDGDSVAQLRLSEVAVQSLDEVLATPSFQSGALFSDFG